MQHCQLAASSLTVLGEVITLMASHSIHSKVKKYGWRGNWPSNVSKKAETSYSTDRRCWSTTLEFEVWKVVGFNQNWVLIKPRQLGISTTALILPPTDTFCYFLVSAKSRGARTPTTRSVWYFSGKNLTQCPCSFRVIDFSKNINVKKRFFKKPNFQSIDFWIFLKSFMKSRPP